MSRLVVHSATSPFKIEKSDKDQYVCMCGLSNNKPFCSGAHKQIKDETDDELIVYDEQGKKIDLDLDDECGCGMCIEENDHECGCDHGHDHGEIKDKSGKEKTGCCGGGCGGCC